MEAFRPNVILITTDQQRTDTLGSYGSPFAKTPNLDSLAASGAVCQRAYTTNPVCTPARVSLFTGLQVSRHGAWNIGVHAPAPLRTIAHRLDEIGYRAHNVGKMHFQSWQAEPAKSAESRDGWATFFGPYYGFQTVEFSVGHSTYGLRGHYGEWVRSHVGDEVLRSFETAQPLTKTSFGGEAYDWNLPARLHSSSWTVDRALDFLQHRETSRPFFLVLGFQDPHHPHCLPRDFTLRHHPDEIPPPDYTDGELDDKPPHFSLARTGQLETSAFRGEYPMAGQHTGFDFRNVSAEDAALGRAYYHGMVRLIDQQMGRLLAHLDTAGLTENTLVIFTSDHGELLGDHGLWMKGPFHYEQILRIPLLLRWPAGFAGNQQLDGIVSHLDLVPTILSAVGQPIDASLDGVDALPLLRGETKSIRDGALVECVDDPRKLRLKTFITPTRKLTWYHGHDFGEFYDLVADPREKINRWNDPAYAADRQRLLARIMEKLEPLERRAPRDTYV